MINGHNWQEAVRFSSVWLINGHKWREAVKSNLVANRLVSIRSEKYRVAKGPMGGCKRTKFERTRSRNIQTPNQEMLYFYLNGWGIISCDMNFSFVFS